VSEYTPDTEEVRMQWETSLWEGVASDESRADAQWDGGRMNAQFDRWLESVKAEAWGRGFGAGVMAQEHHKNGASDAFWKVSNNPHTEGE
jgi:hypothetical protein